MAKNSTIVKVWVKKDDPEYKLYSYGDHYTKLQAHIKDFPIIQSEINESRRSLADTKYYHFRIALYYSDEIETFNVQHPDVDFFQSQIGDVNRDGSEEGAEFSPIIHILQKDADIFLSEKYTQNHRDAPRFRFIVDSGIWNYLATNKADFRNDVIDIVANWSVGYYDLFIAREFADLNARLTKASYLYERKDNKGGGGSGHGADVSPFLFHSETQLRERINAVDVSKYKWRFLLLDDKIDKEKKEVYYNQINGNSVNIERKAGVLSSNDPKSTLTKADILKIRINQISIGKCDYILSKHYEKLPIPKDYNVQIVCVETVQDAFKLMEQYEFDIILLDYLLKNDYGYQLLNKLKGIKAGSSNIFIGPQEKNFFMFISAFTTAVNERLTLEGLSRDEEYWVIGEGACPTNTPELFKYRLTHLMERRLEQTGIKYLSYSNILKTVQKIFLIDEEEKGPDKKRRRIDAVRKRAYETYHEILGFHYDYYVLREKDKGNSILVDSFLKKQVHLGAMLEHLLQLVHLTAFGTVRQWPEIWEECQFFSRTVNNSSDDTENISSLKNEIIADIEKYIIDLKSE